MMSSMHYLRADLSSFTNKTRESGYNPIKTFKGTCLSGAMPGYHDLVRRALWSIDSMFVVLIEESNGPLQKETLCLLEIITMSG